MIQKFKRLSTLKGKKRYFLLAFLAMELTSLPAAAHIVKQVVTAERPLVTAVEIPSEEPGLSRYLVTSTAGFTVRANNISGDIETSLHVSGTLGGTSKFGAAAQLPGPKTVCAQTSAAGTHIYEAHRSTAAKSGSIADQAIVIEFRYSAGEDANFDFSPGETLESSITHCEA